MRTLVSAFGGVAVGCAALSGCSFEFGTTSTPTVSQDALQNDIADRLSKAGEKPQSVTCDGSLIGEVGKTTRCDVVISRTNSFQPVITVTKVDGTMVSYDINPAISKEQLEKYISARDSDAGLRVESVSCESGLDGKKGAITYCDTEAPKGTFRRNVEITDVDGLLMDLSFVPVYTKNEIATGLLDILEQKIGHRPDSATCDDDLVGEEDNTIDCTVTDGSDEQVYTLTVTGVEGDNIDFSYAPKE
ncbi:MAG: DUF4333 domain-containing protein [Mycobacterium sp.]